MLFRSKSRLRLLVAEIGVVVLFLLVGVMLSLTMPLIRGRDELAHFRFARFIAEYGRLPLTWAERDEAGYKSEWPPLFHLLVGMAGQGIDLDSPPFINPRVIGNNPRAQLVLGPESLGASYILSTEDPYQGEVLLWYLGRWLTLLSGLLGVIVSYLLIRVFYPEHNWMALSAAMFFAFIPNYIRTSAVMSYDPLLGVPLTFYVGLLFYTIQKPDRNWPYLALGLLMGVAALIKYTPLSAAPLVPLLILGLAYQGRWPWRVILWRLLLFGLGLLLTFGSWLFYMEFCFNRVAELGWVSGLLYPLLAGNLAVGDDTSIWFANLVTGGELGKPSYTSGNGSFFRWLWELLVDIWDNPWLAGVFLGLFGLALVGLVREWRQIRPLMLLWLVVLAAHSGLLMVFPIFRFFSTGEVNINTVAGQHVIFPIGAPLLLLLIQGLRVWLTPSRLAALFLSVVIICLAQNVAFAMHTYRLPLPIRSVPLSAHEQTLAAFDKISLIGYESTVDSQTLAVTLFWRAESFINQDYRIELTVLDDRGKPVARWLGQPLNGYYPTRAWWPGVRVRDLIHIPIAGLSPGDYKVQLRLLGESGPLASIQAHTSLVVSEEHNNLNLGGVTLAPSAPAGADTVILEGQEIGYTLWMPDQSSPAAKPVYRERATIVVLTREPLGTEIRLSLVGPDGQAHGAIDHTQHLYIFNVEPNFVSGDYHLRFERWSNDKLKTQAETASLLQIQTPQRQFQIGPISHPVAANFAGYISLLGYDLPQRRVEAGDKLLVTLHWQALRTIEADLITFNHLIDGRKELWGSQDRRVRGVYSTFLWVPNEIVADPFYLQVDPNTPDGIYHLLVGLYLPLGKAPVVLPLMQNNQLTDITNVNIGPIKIGRTPPGFTVEAASPQHSLNQPFGPESNLTLLGYDLNPPLINSCQVTSAKCQVSLILYWRCESPVSLDYTTFIHVRNAANEIVAQQDQPPLNGAYPTGLWDPGEIIADEITVALPADLPAGTYEMVVGMYDFQTGQRLAVPNSTDNSLTLTKWEITP